MDLAFEDGMTDAQKQRWCATHEYLLKKITYFRKGKRILFKARTTLQKWGCFTICIPMQNLYISTATPIRCSCPRFICLRRASRP